MWAHATFQPIVRGKKELIHPLNPTSPEKSSLISVIHVDIHFLCHDLKLICLYFFCILGSGQGVGSRRIQPRIQMWLSLSQIAKIITDGE